MAEAVPTAASPTPVTQPAPSPAPAAPGTPVEKRPSESTGQAPAPAAAPPVPTSPASEVPKGPSPGEQAAALARERRELNRQQAAIRAAQDQLAKDKTELAEAEKNPVAYWIKKGKTTDQLVELIAKGEEAVDANKAEAEALKRKVDALEARDNRREAEAAAKAQAAVVGQFKDRLNEHLTAQAEKYPLIAPVAEFLGHSAADLVYAVMDAHWMRTAGPDGKDGELLTFDAACEIVNTHYKTRADAFIGKVKPGAPVAAPDAGKNGGQSQGAAPATPLKPGSPAASPQAGGPTRVEPQSGSRPTTLTNALQTAPSVDGGDKPRRSRGLQAIDQAINAAIAKRPS